ncbi:Orotidine 5'-phosphate decarboxylase [Pseudobythopirellula maris]|uniref:Orotidine 5'-phosphate decarboxylase n=1 Tax=Pseudobythopirellula maris TaxID=2527991 RepID=A0A5C5ZUP9_9BACT|nr:orotidine-5'-phosphate decarboxylase [Pseudobythopirellula maris]TWT89933.1 Orotidine 5'-phosphate decarboxylase [Pseudobythopirellula maris]
MPHFMDALAAAVRAKRSPLMVGLDPRLASLPDAIRPEAEAPPAVVAESFRVFCCGVVDAVADLTPIVKPQAAFFEQLGPAGMGALGAVIEHARAAGLLVCVDGKRNDIGSTAEAYADGWLGRSSAWGGDALTVSPYLGDDSLEPFTKLAAERDAGVFVLVKTSNPGGKLWQDRQIDGRPLYRHVGEHVESLAAAAAADCGYGVAGAVVGATYPEQLAELRAAMPHTWFLIPGFGAQGGSAADTAGGFDANGLGAVVNSSRGVIFAHAKPEHAGRDWQDAVRAAAAEAVEQFRAETPTGGL